MILKSARRISLQCQLTILRTGWTPVFALFCLVVCFVSASILHPRLLAEDGAVSQEILATTHSIAALPGKPIPPAPTESEQHLQKFHDLLGDDRYVEQQVDTIFSIAEKNGLTLHAGEYQHTFNQLGEFSTYSISLPVHGDYASIRTFCTQVLLAIPFSSLDEISFRRENIVATNLDARLRFTLYLQANTGLDRRATTGGAS